MNKTVGEGLKNNSQHVKIKTMICKIYISFLTQTVDNVEV